MGFETLRFMCGALYKDFILASCLEFNGLYKIYYETGENEYLGSFPNETLVSKNLHRNAFIVNDLVYFIPYKAINIQVYNISRRSFYEITVERNGYKGGYIGIQSNEDIYLVPESKGGSVLKLDTKTDNIKIMVTADTLLTLINSDKVSSKLFLRICLQNDRLWLPLYKTNIILELIVTSGRIIKHNLNIENIFGCFNGKNGIWILGNNGNSIYKWNLQSCSVIKMDYDCNCMRKKRCFNWIIDIGSNVYVLPAWGESILILKNNEFVEFECVEKTNTIYQKFFASICSDGDIFLLPMGIEYMLKIEGNEIREIELQKINSESKLYDEILHTCVNETFEEPLNENTILSLYQFIAGLIS